MGGAAKVGIAVAAVAAIGLAAALISGNTEGGKKYRVPSQAMEPALEIGEIVRVDEGAYDDGPPRVGDIVVFHPPTGADPDRFGSPECEVATGGHRLCAQPGSKKSDLSFIKRVVALPGDSISIEGGRSDDSRFWGPVPEDWIIGRVKED